MGRHATIGQPRKGFALLGVLWLVVAIAAVALEFSLKAHDQRTIAINVVERGEAAEAAAAGIETTRARLGRLLRDQSAQSGESGQGTVDPNDPWRYVDSLYSSRDTVGAGAYQAAVRDAGRYLNINNMSEQSWRTFLTGLGIDFDEADHLSQAIMDWRDPDTLSRVRGAEIGEYRHERRLVLPPNRNFARVEELRDVIGMTPQIYAQIRPYIATGVSGQININVADIAVLRTLPGFNDEVVTAVLAARESGQEIHSLPELMGAVGGPAAAQITANLPLLANAITFAANQILVTSVGWSPGRHTHVVSRAVLVRGVQDIITAWREDE